MDKQLSVFLNFKNIAILNDRNAYEYIYMWKKDYGNTYTYDTINYKLIIDFLLLLNTNKFNYDKCQIYNLEDYKDTYFYNYLKICDEKMNYDTCLNTEIKNILKLYNSFIKIPFLKDVYYYNKIPIKSENLILYRGFSYERYEKLFKLIDNDNIMVGSKIITPTFLSTTIIEQITAMFTTSKNDENNIIWKIIIPNKKFNTFNYSYIGNNMNLNNLDYNSLFNNADTYEAEFLLNFGAKLECKSIDNMIFEDKNNMFQQEKIVTFPYKLYTFEFLEYDNNYQNEFANQLYSIQKCKTKHSKTSLSSAKKE